MLRNAVTMSGSAFVSSSKLGCWMTNWNGGERLRPTVGNWMGTTWNAVTEPSSLRSAATTSCWLRSRSSFGVRMTTYWPEFAAALTPPGPDATRVRITRRSGTAAMISGSSSAMRASIHEKPEPSGASVRTKMMLRSSSGKNSRGRLVKPSQPPKSARATTGSTSTGTRNTPRSVAANAPLMPSSTRSPAR